MLDMVALGCAHVVVFVVSRPGESHPQPLSERCVSLSTHTAPIKQTRQPSHAASAQTDGAVARDTLYEAARSRLVPLKPSVLPHRPRHQRLVEMPQHRGHRRWIIPPVVLQPPPKHRVVVSCNIFQAQSTPVAKVAPPRGLPHAFDAAELTAGVKLTKRLWRLKFRAIR